MIKAGDEIESSLLIIFKLKWWKIGKWLPRVKIFKKGTNYKLAKGNFSGMTETFDMIISDDYTTVPICQLELYN